MMESKNASRFADAMIVDLDGSVDLPEVPARIELRPYEESIRYSCTFGDLKRLEATIKEAPRQHRIFLCGSGDFHHLSYLMIKHIPCKKVQVVVFDNHPDNMFFPFGIHCGSWVYHASKLPNVTQIAVFGIASRDLSGLDLIQNRFSAVKSGKVVYFCLQPVTRIAKFMSGYRIEDISTDGRPLAEVVQQHVQKNGNPVYLSIDKDVLAHEAIAVTWDQGKMSEQMLLDCIETLSSEVVAADIFGDLSSYIHKNPLKRILRRLDGPESLPRDLERERGRHRELNLKILAMLTRKTQPFSSASL